MLQNHHLILDDRDDNGDNDGSSDDGSSNCRCGSCIGSSHIDSVDQFFPE